MKFGDIGLLEETDMKIKDIAAKVGVKYSTCRYIIKKYLQDNGVLHKHQHEN